MSLAALGTLVWRHPLADVAAKAAAPIGASFTFLALVTGSLWGRPMWGTYWEWDARLTSVLILFLMYLGLIALWRTVEDPSRAARAAAILSLLFLTLHLAAMRNEILRRRVRALQLIQVAQTSQRPA
jgi:heme exporter protein C